MKRCPKCGRTFTKDTQRFCTHDGGSLVPAAIDPNTTVSDVPDQDPMNAPTTRISRDLLPPTPPAFNPYATVVGARPPASDPAALDTGPLNPPPVAPPSEVSAPLPPPSSAPLPSPVAAPMPPAAASTAPPVFAQPAPPKKKSKMPLILGVLVVLLLLGGGGLVAGYFFLVKPMLDEQTRNLRVGPPETNVNSNANVAQPSPTAEETPTVATVKEPPPFEPPADAVEFVNSKDNLDGKLAAHYLDFSFYYPDSWKKDPQAGVPGASSFVNVQRRLSGDTPERFAVGWYTSRGSLQADLPYFPKLIEDFNANFGKGYPAYRKLSEGQTKVNAYDAYEFRFQSVANDVTTWGRVIFLPPTSGTNGATLFMLATSEQPDVTGAEDVGVKGELPIVLESFRLGAKQ